MLNLSIIGAGGGEYVRVSGRDVDPYIALGKGQVTGLYHAPVETSWTSARRQRGASFDGLSHPGRDMQIGFHVTGENGGDVWSEQDARLRALFTYRLDQWWPGDELAQIEAELDGDVRRLHVQMREEPELKPDLDPSLLQWGNTFYKLKAAQPFWESRTVTTTWVASSASDSGTIRVSNPTDVEMFQVWELDVGTWTVPDVAWESGAPRRRAPSDSRAIELQPVTAAMGGLVIDLGSDRQMEAANGQNVLGQVGGGYWFLHTIPPHTPPTDLPISVTGADAGATARLHQPRLWTNVVGGW